MFLDSVPKPPVVVAQNRNQEAPVGSNVTLRCRTEHTNIAPNVNWYRESLQLPLSSVVNGEYLHLYNLHQSDAGRYYCEYASPRGVSTDYINLTVTGKFVVLSIYFYRFLFLLLFEHLYCTYIISCTAH